MTLWVDMMTQSLSSRAEWLAIGTPIRVDEDDRVFRAAFYQKPAQTDYIFGRERQFVTRIFARGPVDIIP